MYHIIINPASRSGKGQKGWEKAEPLFKESGEEYEAHFSTEEKGIRDIVRELTEAAAARRREALQEQPPAELLPPDRFWAVWEAPERPENKTDLIIMGGDGSLNEALNGVSDFSAVRIGMIPIGSGNDFAQDAKISANIEETVKSILTGDRQRKLDLGRVTWKSETEPSPEEGTAAPAALCHRNFIISSGVGFDAQVCYDADHSRWKKLLNKIGLGKLIYIFTAIRLILTAKRARLEVDLHAGDGSSKQMEFDDCLFAVCMNHRFEGGGFQFSPEADPADGKLDLCIPSGISKLRFFLLFPKAYSGGHVGAKGIHILKGSRVIIRSDIPLYIHTDGEVPDRTREAEMTLLPGALEMLN